MYARWELLLVTLTVSCYCWTAVISQSDEGDACTTANLSGVCKTITECPKAETDLRKGIHPQLCGFKGKAPVVCCQAVAPRNLGLVHQECGPIPPEASKVQPTGSKTWNKCIEHLQYVYPCRNLTTLKLCSTQGEGKNHCNNRKVQREYICKHDESLYPTIRPVFARRRRSKENGILVHTAAVGGKDAKENEFPHMALLGYGSKVESAEWLCGGSVVSESYVLTAGHCTFARDVPIFSRTIGFSKVEFVRVGMVRLKTPIESSRLHRVSQIIKHPDYRPPNRYNDIALLKTATHIILDSQVYPACLHTGNVINDIEMIATGWGALWHGGKNAEVLQKVTLQKFNTDDCSPLILTNRNLKSGLNHESQLCAGHIILSRDTCQGDSGGPLQIYNQDVNCMYTVVGVTSFGWGCGVIGSPGVYTRVSYYVPWIESIVWPKL